MAEAMNYSMLSGGKRLRPVFMREVYSMFGGTGKVIELYGGNGDDSYPFADS